MNRKSVAIIVQISVFMYIEKKYSYQKVRISLRYGKVCQMESSIILWEMKLVWRLVKEAMQCNAM